MCLKDKRPMPCLGLLEHGFTQQEVLNTFTPILESMARNMIPPFYRISTFNIFIDHRQNVRLASPLVTFHHSGAAKDMTNFQEIAISILEFTLNMVRKKVIMAVQNRPKLIQLLVRRKYSFRIISLVLILLSDGQ